MKWAHFFKCTISIAPFTTSDIGERKKMKILDPLKTLNLLLKSWLPITHPHAQIKNKIFQSQMVSLVFYKTYKEGMTPILHRI